MILPLPDWRRPSGFLNQAVRRERLPACYNALKREAIKWMHEYMHMVVHDDVTRKMISGSPEMYDGTGDHVPLPRLERRLFAVEPPSEKIDSAGQAPVG